MDDFHLLKELVARNPEQAWPRVLAYVRAHPGHASTPLIEDLVYLHDNLFVDRIEAAARQHPEVREVVDGCYVGGDASLGAERFNDLQERLLRERLWESES